MNDKEKIRAVVERCISDYNHSINGVNRRSWVGAVTMLEDTLEYISKFIDSLPEEPASEGLEEEIQNHIWHTMDETPNYPCDILFLTDVGSMFLYRYMENGRPVDMETPYFNNILNGRCWCYCNDIMNKAMED